MKLTGKNRSNRGKTCPSATLSTTNPIWTDSGSNPGLRGDRPATNRLRHGTALLPGGLLMSTVARDGNFRKLPLRFQRAFTDMHIGYILAGSPSRKRPLGRLRCRRGINSDLNEAGCEGVDWNWTGFWCGPVAGSYTYSRHQLTFRFHKRRGISRVAERLSVSTERLQGFSYDIACRTEHTSTVFMRAGITMSR
jgi:hypothetical protein